MIINKALEGSLYSSVISFIRSRNSSKKKSNLNMQIETPVKL